MTDTPEQIAAKLTEAQRGCLMDLPENQPWLMGDPKWADYECRLRFYGLGMVEPRFPEAKTGDSGRQFWVFNDLGLQVRAILERCRP